MIRNRGQRGFSLAEMLTVIAIIGVMSLVSVPAFLNYQRSLELKNAMRQFTTDLRTAQRRAVTNMGTVTVDVPASGYTARTYTMTETRNAGGIASLPRSRTFSSNVPYFANTGTITFLPNGTVQFPAGVSSRTITIDSQNKYGKKSYAITVNLAGRVSVL